MQSTNAIDGEKQSEPFVPPPPPEDDKEEKKDTPREMMSGLGPNGEVYGVSRGYLRSSLMKGIETGRYFDKSPLAVYQMGVLKNEKIVAMVVTTTGR